MKQSVVFFGTVSLLLLVGLSQACTRPPTPASRPPPRPAPPRCTSINDRSRVVRSGGMAPLYNDESDGNEYIVVLEKDMDPVAMKKKVDNTRSSGINKIVASKSLNGPADGINAVVLNLNKGDLDQIRKMEGVKYVEKSVMFKQSGRTSVWGLDRIDERSLPLDGHYSPSSGNGNGVTVYVVDSGVNTHHYKFGGRAVNWHEAVTDREQDCTGHGTHVAGTIAATTYGVATGVNIRSVRVFGCSEKTATQNILDGINYILANGRSPSGSIVSMSLEGPQSTVIDDAVKSLIRAGFIVVVAAGNGNEDACGISPARVTEAITVGATDEKDTRSDFSNYGTGVDIFAPGERVRSLSNSINYGTTVNDGTSMSAPHVAGVAAILRSRGVPASQVRQRIIDLSTKGVVNDPKGSHNRLLYIN